MRRSSPIDRKSTRLNSSHSSSSYAVFCLKKKTTAPAERFGESKQVGPIAAGLQADLVILKDVLFFFNHTPTTEIYTLSLHDALPISSLRPSPASTTAKFPSASSRMPAVKARMGDRKSTRLNSSHSSISYAVFCL